MKWISSISAYTLIFLLSGINHLAQAREEEVGLAATRLQKMKSKMCSFMEQSQEDQLLILSDFVKRNDEAELKKEMCAVASERITIQKFLSDSDVVSCLTKEMNVDIVTMAKEAMGTKDSCDSEIYMEVSLIKDGSRSLRGVVDRELRCGLCWWIVVVVILILREIADDDYYYDDW